MAEISEKQLQVLEKLIGDESFRQGFFEDSEAALTKAGLEVSAEELAGLKKIDRTAIDGFLSDVDERLSKSQAGSVIVLSPEQAASVVLSALSEWVIP
jgi:hypothetical protein